MIYVKSLHIYPIKSCYRVNIDKADITAAGIVHDRRWMLVNASGRFLSQRDFPQMALIKPVVDGESLTINLPTKNITLPIYTEDYELMDVSVWESDCKAQTYGKEISQYLSEFLQTECHLVTMDKNFQRKVTSSKAAQEDVVSFADSYPFLLTSMESLEDLNSRIKNPNDQVPITRFRPNIVVEGNASAFAEDHWKRIRIGDAEFHAPKISTRCKVICIDQETGRRNSAEPLKTLGTYRVHDRTILFGKNLQHIAGTGTTIKVGDAIEVVE